MKNFSIALTFYKEKQNCTFSLCFTRLKALLHFFFFCSVIIIFVISLWKDLANAKEIEDTYTIAVNKNFPPFSSTNELGELIGFDVDIAKSICKELSIECTIKDYRIKEIIPAIQSGEVLFAVASMSETKERKKLVDFSKQYYKSVNIFFERSGEKQTITPKTIKGLRVGVENSSSEQYFLKEKYGKDIHIVEGDEVKQLFQYLKTGRVEVIYINSFVGYNYLLRIEEGTFEPAESFSKNKEEIHSAKIALQKGNTSLIEDINRSLDIIMRSGEFQRINRKYFDYITLFTSKD